MIHALSRDPCGRAKIRPGYSHSSRKGSHFRLVGARSTDRGVPGNKPTPRGASADSRDSRLGTDGGQRTVAAARPERGADLSAVGDQAMTEVNPVLARD